MGLDGKVAWITGGGTGIGAAGARALAEAGARVVVSGRRAEPLEELAREIGGEAIALDVADAGAVDRAVAQIGPVDILVASAGTNVPARSMAEVETEGWQRVVDVNLNGVFHAARAVMPGMRARGGGVLMLVSSWAGRHATRLTGAAYNASKHAVVALSESINTEEGANGIRSTAILPGEVATDILQTRPVPPSREQMDRMLQAEDLGATIRFVAEMPPRVCLNEILISPTWNRFYLGFEEL
ncbi:SDR family oxidoreductase [Marinibacterium sp. SX1]|uniref:SDR family oxidoreductase n=1 Tax=Marinibacterium sp. SX1 TaxID=3388424 RepID=UPI003D16F493